METRNTSVQVAKVVASLLDRLDASTQAVDAHQYQVVAVRLKDLLRDDSVDWTALLTESPAAAEVYEDLHYATQGLACEPAEAAHESARLMRETLAVARRIRPVGWWLPIPMERIPLCYDQR